MKYFFLFALVAASVSVQAAQITKRFDVTYPNQQTYLNQEANPRLNEIASYMKSHPDTKLLIQGHTDNVGSVETNMKVSKARADAVKNYLVKKEGLEASRISSEGFGSKYPIATNSTPEGRADNRRVIGAVTL